MLPGGFLTPKGLVPGMEGRKPCRGTQTGRLTLCTSTLLPLGTVLCVTLWVMQGEGVALSQLVFLHQARGAGSLWAQLFSHLPFAAYT